MLFINKNDGGQIIDLTKEQLRFLSKEFKNGLSPYQPKEIEIPEEYENEFDSADGEGTDLLHDETDVDDDAASENSSSEKTGNDNTGGDTIGRNGNTRGVSGAVSKPTGKSVGRPK